MAIKKKTLRGIQPNAGIENDYERKLVALITAMHKSVEYWLKAAYKKHEPSTMAKDDSSASALNKVMRKLASYWISRFNKAGPDIAKHFATKAIERADSTLERALKESGFAVEFKLTEKANDVLQSTIQANVSLIKSIASEHFTEIEGMVMRSVQVGGDLGGLAKNLEKRFGITKRRARFISRDQNSKATAAITKVRQEELGITQAKWLHSHAGKEPRPTHVAMNGQVYDIDKGMWDKDADGKDKGRFVYPGELINCRCVSRSIVPRT